MIIKIKCKDWQVCRAGDIVYTDEDSGYRTLTVIKKPKSEIISCFGDDLYYTEPIYPHECSLMLTVAN